MSLKNDSQLKNWIRKIYLKIFEREPDAEGLAFFVNKVKNNEIQLDKIPSIFKDNTEFDQLQKKKVKQYEILVMKPIFIFGVPRSGTTFLYDILCRHKDLAWFTDYDLPDLIPKDKHKTIIENWKKIKFSNNKVPQTEEHFFASMEYRKIIGRPLLKPTSIEGEVFWRRFFGEGFFTSDISLEVKIGLLKEIANFLKMKNKHRFLNKAPQNCMRLFALQKCFPDAKFINIHRDPRAVVSSMIERDVEEGHFDTGIPIQNKTKYNTLDNVQKWAWQYKEITELIHEFAIKQTKDIFMTVNYEELLSSPLKVVKNIIEFCELPPPNNKTGYNAIQDLLPPIKKNTTKKWKNKLSNEDQKKIFEITDSIMKKMNRS